MNTERLRLDLYILFYVLWFVFSISILVLLIIVSYWILF